MSKLTDNFATSTVSRLSNLTRKAAGDLRIRGASIHSHCRELFEFSLALRYSHLPRYSPGLCGVAESVGGKNVAKAAKMSVEAVVEPGKLLATVGIRPTIRFMYGRRLLRWKSTAHQRLFPLELLLL